jgi:serine protease
MATPHVAGLAALVLSRGAQTPAALETLIKNNARAFPTTCSGCGTGIINAAATIAALGGGGGGGGGGTSFFENQTDFQIRDNTTINSPISVTGRTGNAPSTLQVSVTIYHTYRGDLKVDLVAPDGSVYVLHNRSGGSADNIIATYTVNASSELANGTWNLRVNDNAAGDTGYLDKWSLQF